MSRGEYTFTEITSQPAVWRSTLAGIEERRGALERFLNQAEFEQVVVTGCGSTHCLAMTAASLITHYTGIPAYGMPASQVWLYPSLIPPKRTLLLPISRSGTTTETLRALKRFRADMEGPVLAITCYPDRALAAQSDFVVAAPANGGILDQMSALPDILDRLMREQGELPRKLGEDLDIERIFFLGNGALYGIACEAMLKMKEMSITYVEPYHFLEFRHGPMSMVNDATLVTGFVSDTAQKAEVRVLKDMAQLGAQTLAVVDDVKALAGWQPSHRVELGSGLDDWVRVPLYLPLIQLMAYYRSMAKGLDPDNPQHLSAVIKLDEES